MKDQIQTGIQNDETLMKIEIRDFDEKIIKLFAEDWFLLTACKDGKYNSMTIGWGTIGVLWGQPVVTVYVRPNRYTYEFMEKSKTFTISAFGNQYHEKLEYFGSVSGRTEDKIEKSQLTPVISDSGSMYFSEARIVIECEKIFSADMNVSSLADKKSLSYYTNENPAHKMYIGKILNVLKKNEE